jgi:AcrR family transcriptional regulator
MSNDDPKRLRLLDAALAVFARYGFRRASMGDIAAEAGVSRPALYLHFRSKSDVLHALAGVLRDRILAAATAGWQEGAPFADNLEATLLGKELDVFRLLRGAPHGAEILDADASLTAGITAELDRAFRDLLTRRIDGAAAAGSIDLACVGGSAAALADLLAVSARGVMNDAADEAALRAGLARLARLTAAAVRPA